MLGRVGDKISRNKGHRKGHGNGLAENVFHTTVELLSDGIRGQEDFDRSKILWSKTGC